MNPHETTLISFLSGDLGGEAAREFDEHLFRCEECWQAVREERAGRAALAALRQPAPAGLEERIRLAVELQAVGPAPQRSRRGSLVGSAVCFFLAGLAVALWVSLGAPARQTAVGTVAHFAQMVPSPTRMSRVRQEYVPVSVGAPLALKVGGQRLNLVYYRVDGTEAVVATSARPFLMPDGGHSLRGAGGMAWVAKQDGISLYCLNGRESTLLAGSMSSPQLFALAGELHLTLPSAAGRQPMQSRRPLSAS